MLTETGGENGESTENKSVGMMDPGKPLPCHAMPKPGPSTDKPGPSNSNRLGFETASDHTIQPAKLSLQMYVRTKTHSGYSIRLSGAIIFALFF